MAREDIPGVNVKDHIIDFDINAAVPTQFGVITKIRMVVKHWHNILK